MSFQKLTGALQELVIALQQARDAKIEQVDALPAKTLTSFQQARHQALCASVSTAKSKFSRYAQQLIENPMIEHELAVALKKYSKALEIESVSELQALTEQIATSLASLGRVAREEELNLPKNIPADIYEELRADAYELRNCLKAKCYRSVVILAGRILEVALHRKYYEATGNDLLEKSPGIGLGNVIARLAQHNIMMDPGLGNQIHLINRVRVFSVHKKQQLFRPSEAQAKAIALYTFDVLEKIFTKRVAAKH